MDTEQRPPGAAASFLRLWFVLGFSYVLLRLAVVLFVDGVVDLRAVAFWEALVVPPGQALVVLAIRRATPPRR